VAIMEKLVLAGANPQTALMVKECGVNYRLSAVSIIKMHLLENYPSEGASLLRALKCPVPKKNANGKRHRDEGDMDSAESPAKRALLQFLEMIRDTSRKLQRPYSLYEIPSEEQNSSFIRGDAYYFSRLLCTSSSSPSKSSYFGLFSG
jgi:hypothetical protein